MTEIVKRNAAEFAGFQLNRMRNSEIASRWCCAAGCSSWGRVQFSIAGGRETISGYRIVCGRHAVLCHMMGLGILGDPSPIGEIKSLCEIYGVDWEALLKSEPIHPTLPENFRCLRCGGGYLAETIGMFAGKRYIHNCEVEVR